MILGTTPMRGAYLMRRQMSRGRRGDPDVRVRLSGMTIIDADAHVVESAFGVEALRRWPERVKVRTDGRLGLLIDGRLYPQDTGPGAGCPPEHGVNPRANEPATQKGFLGDADTEGIDQVVLFPSLALCVPSLDPGPFAREFARAYNEWVADWCSFDRTRLFGVAAVPIEDVAGSIELMREAEELGLVATMLPPALRERNLDHPDLDPFYSAAEELDMPLGVHGAPGVHMPKIGVDRFDNHIQVHCVSFPFDMMTAMTALVSGGVFERHPRLRVALLESGVGWVPYLVDRLHEHYEKRGDWVPNGWQRDPREYVERGQLYVSCEPAEPMLPAAIADLGADFVMFASDYPHWDGEFPNATKPIRERDDLADDDRAKVLAENARRFFALPSS
jgi:predicted TIM-barrel fold metal-dependent hydrolase